MTLRRSPMRRTARRATLPQTSDERRAVINTTHARSGGVCELSVLIPEVPRCWGPLDCDERKSRGVNPGGELDPTNTQSACRAHHRWRTEHPVEAEQRGIRVRSSFERDGFPRRLR